jgi:hypothetical protein
MSAVTREPYGYVGNNPLNATDPLGLFCVGSLCTPSAQDVANVAGGILNGITLGHADLFVDEDKVRWDSGAARVGNVVGTILDIPLAVGAPAAFGGALFGSSVINGYNCYQQGLPPGCLAPALVTGALGGWGGLFGSWIGPLGGLLFGNLFNLNYSDGRYDMELAAAYSC